MVRRAIGLVLALIVLLSIGMAAPASAAVTSAQAPQLAKKRGGITIAPAFQQIVVEQTDTEKTFDFAVTNNTTQPLEFSLSAVDFGSLDESGGVLFLGSGDKTVNYKYGLSRYVTLQQDRIVVEQGATTKVPITISNKESLSPGGHYGAIMVTPTGVVGSSDKVQVMQVLSSLLFINKKGGEIYKLGLNSFELKTHIFSPPSAVDMRFQNAGNVHLIPRGLITITDPRGRIVQRGYINAGSGMILPETFRKISVPLQSLRTAWWPGVYHMTLSYRFDGQIGEETKQLTFTYVNGWYIVAFMVLLAVAIVYIISRPFRRFCMRLGRIVARPFVWLGMRLKLIIRRR